MLKTIHLEQSGGVLLSWPGNEADSIVPARGSKMFVGVGDTNIRLKSVRVFGKKQSKTGDGEVLDLRATAVLVPDATIEEGVLRAYPIKDGRIEGVRTLSPAERFFVKVENSSNEALEVRATTMVSTSIGEEPSVDFPEDGLVPLYPKVGEAARRIVVPAHGTIDARVDFPYACRVRRITVRSDSKLDVSFMQLQMANISFLHGDAVPVEFFFGGLDLRSPRMTAANRVSASFCNKSDQDRYVEVDVGIESAADEPASKGRANAN